MKAIIHTKFGPPDELQLKEVEKPVPKDNEVLIKIHATSVTTSDCNMHNLTFVPKMYLLPAKLFMFGMFKPRKKILGIEFSGTVEETGKSVKLFKKGDEVFGTPFMALGSYAEYLCIPETGVLTRKPANATFEEAAVISLAANTALHFIRDLGNIQKGQKILIHGVSGAIGTFAVQLAKYYGAEVTGVCSTANLEMVKSIGADKVIDYTKEDYSKSGETYDAVFDVVGKTSFKICKNLLKEKGVYLANLIDFNEMLHILMTSVSRGKKVKGGMAVDSVENLKFLRELFEKGKLKPVIDRIYPLGQIAEAFKYVEAGHKKGNVVITVEHKNKT